MEQKIKSLENNYRSFFKDIKTINQILVQNIGSSKSQSTKKFNLLGIQVLVFEFFFRQIT